MNDVRKMGRVTIPTDTDAVSETLDLLKRWGADAIRDCDGTEFPQELKDTGAKIYATYYTTRKDNAWAKANPDETQQCYIMTPFYTAEGGALTIPLMTGISRELMKVNDHDDIARWWEVMDRTTGEPVPTSDWCYDTAAESVVIDAPAAYHEYTVSFLAYLIWDPVHMYNSVINDWKDVEHQIPFDVRQPKTHVFYEYYRLTGDKEFLRTREEPYFTATAACLEELLQEGPDGKLVLPVSSSPEIHDDEAASWLTPNSNYDLALLHYLFQTLVQIEYQLSKPRSHWHAIEAKLAPLSVDTETGLMLSPDETLQETHRHFSHAMAIEPLCMLRYENPQDRSVIDATVDHLVQLGSGQWVGFSLLLQQPSTACSAREYKDFERRLDKNSAFQRREYLVKMPKSKESYRGSF